MEVHVSVKVRSLHLLDFLKIESGKSWSQVWEMN